MTQLLGTKPLQWHLQRWRGGDGVRAGTGTIGRERSRDQLITELELSPGHSREVVHAAGQSHTPGGQVFEVWG